MTNFFRRVSLAAVLGTALVGLPAAASAQDEEPREMPREKVADEKPESSSSSDSSFSTTWFGARLGFWYQPELDLKMKIGGVPSFAVVNQLFPNTKIDVRDDLSV